MVSEVGRCAGTVVYTIFFSAGQGNLPHHIHGRRCPMAWAVCLDPRPRKTTRASSRVVPLPSALSFGTRMEFRLGGCSGRAAHSSRKATSPKVEISKAKGEEASGMEAGESCGIDDRPER
jgi:hypothetical protein